jgi:hypothetical protein
MISCERKALDSMEIDHFLSKIVVTTDFRPFSRVGFLAFSSRLAQAVTSG